MNELAFRRPQASRALSANTCAITTNQMNVTAEDWDALFGSVLERLKRSVGEVVVSPPMRGPDPAVMIQTIVLECVGALEQLRRERGPTQPHRPTAPENECPRITNLLATLGHELRNPVASISYAVALMHSEKSDLQTQRAMRDLIGRQSDQLNQFLDDFLDGPLTPP
jgi:signal transduction histidine kinase